MNEHSIELLSVTQVSRTLNVSDETVRRMCRSGQLFYTMVGTMYRVSSVSVAAILEGCNRVQPVKAKRMFPKPPNHMGR